MSGGVTCRARWAQKWTGLLLFVSGCTGGRVPLGDGLPDPPDAAPVVLYTEFTTPVLIPNLSNDERHDDDPTLSADLLEIYFSSERDSETGRVWTSRRSQVTDPWPAPTLVPELSVDGDEGGCALSPNGLVFYLSSERTGGVGGLDVYRSSRPDRDTPWGEPTLVTDLSTERDEIVRWVNDAETAVLFARRDADDNYDPGYATRSSASEPFTPVTDFAAFSGDRYASDPFLTLGDTQLFFTQRDEERADEIFATTRTDEGAVFGAGAPVTELNSDVADSDAWLAADGLYVVFASSRDHGNLSLYEARRQVR
jgi:hypothetical protein